MATTNLTNAINPQTGVNSNKKMLNCWEPGVTKFTASNFYNFEQDNLPLYDLEERTYFNWQKLGYSSDSSFAQTGSLHFLVSADAPEADVNCNSNIYRTLQDAIEALPRYIEVPVRISVASFGNLGPVDIDGININPRRGFLEIRNVNAYDRPGIYGGTIAGNPVDSVSGSYYYDAITDEIATLENAQADKALYKGFTSSGTASLLNTYGCGAVANFFLRNTAIQVIPGIIELGFQPEVFDFLGHSSVFSSTSPNLDSRAVNGYYGFMSPIVGLGSLGIRSELSRLSAGEVALTNPTSLGSNKYRVDGSLSLIEESSDTRVKDDIGIYDPSAFHMVTGASLSRQAQKQLFDNASNNTKVAKVVLYGNYIQRLKITNCQGRLWVRNFLCSGEAANFGRPANESVSGAKIGIQIDDCNDVSLESVAVVNYPFMGICLTNSKVTLRRSCYVHRCYGFGDFDLPHRDLKGRRLSRPWAENIQSLDAPITDESAGIAAFNSELILSEDDDFAIYNAGLKALVATLSTDTSLHKPGFHNAKIISRCSTGLKLVNSIFTGGFGKSVTQHATADSTELQEYFNIEGNANYGIDAVNSTIRLKANLQVFQNTRGIRAKNSSIALDCFSIDHNHLYGINIDNTTFTYGGVNQVSATPNLFDYSITNALFNQENSKRYQFLFQNNGQHILANNSIIKPGPARSPIQSYFGRMIMEGAHGAINSQHPIPAVELTNTKADILHLYSNRASVDDEPFVGAHFYIRDNSEVTFLGTASAITCLVGPTTFDQAKKYIALAAEDNSTFRFRGPTVIYNGAVNALAKNNSNLIFEPHKKADGTLDITKFNLTDTKNHTMVELKSIRSCLVADKNSNIVMEDLGSFTENWTTEGTDSSYDYQNAEYTSAGFFQFYPNPNGDVNTYTGDLAAVLSKQGTTYRMTQGGGKYWWGQDLTVTAVNDFSGITNGGVCLRALNNSNVRVRNVNFPCGWWNASSVIYDLNDPLGICGKTFIWNFANNSTLHADHLSVSSAYPSEVGYHGPSALWFSAAGAVAYAAPSSTPDTSTLSVLDAFGYGLANVWPLPNGELSAYGFATPQNQGPFRLYVGVDSLATQLYQSGKPGYATQAFAQGYNVSGNLSALAEVSATYGKILRITDEGTLAASGYYYANEFVKTDPNLIMLDESAANTFANAKNGAMGTSNRPQICTIYSAKTGITGEGKVPAAGSYGSGFRSPNVFDILEEN